MRPDTISSEAFGADWACGGNALVDAYFVFA